MSIARTCSYFRIVFLALTIPALALPAAGSVTSVILNGPTVGANSGYSPISFNQNVTLSDGDVYDVFGSYYATYSDAEGTAIHFNPTVVYEGTSPSVANDNISFIFTQQFFDSRPGTWDGTYSASTPVNFFGLVGADSSVTAEVFYDGQSLGSGTTTTSGVITNSANLTGLNGDTLTGTYDIVYSLNAGTQFGAGASSSTVPEPAEALPLGLGLAAVLWARCKKSA
ncbi:MAG: PEP-CTERM sorting domain-containing protein [Bryobacteraceae bacterium]